jgi:SLOG cluster2
MTNGQPELVPNTALTGVKVAISVSDSADLARLGLDYRHLDLAVSEIARAVLIAGGTIVYGGRLRPAGYTHQLMNEVGRFAAARHALTLCVPFPEHVEMSEDELRRIDSALGIWGRLETLDGEGNKIRWQDRDRTGAPLSDDARTRAYSGLRRYMAQHTEARIVVGGQLRGFKGLMPGVIEEVLYATDARQPVFLAGGFGGAAAAAGRRLDAKAFGWLPDGVPAGALDTAVLHALDKLEAVAKPARKTFNEGLSEQDRQLLYASHRPGEIASLAVLGLARLRGTAAMQG